MKYLLPLLLGMLILVQSCTGQNPAPIKNSTHSRRAVKASCSSIKFEGQVLSKKNILNIFDCSGWGKEYPDLNNTIKNIDAESFDRTFKIFNDTFFSTEEKRKSFYNLIAESEHNGELKSLSYLLEKSLSDHKIISQLNTLLSADKLKNKKQASVLKLASKSNEQNLKILKLTKNILTSYEFSKPVINATLSEPIRNNLPTKIEKIISEISLNMDSMAWKHLSGVVYSDDSPLQNWAIEGSTGNLKVLLDIIGEPSFRSDIVFLEGSLDTGVNCSNSASSKGFNVNVGQELKHKIEGLKTGTKETFEDLLLHGLTKYVAFQEFCEEKTAKQGLKSFFMVLKYAFNVLPSSHDYNFLKRIHQVFGEDRFVFLSFLSSQSFSSLQDLLVELAPSGNDEQFVRSLYEVISGLSLNDFIEASSLLNELSNTESQSSLWLQSWSESWKALSTDDKISFTKLLGVFLSDEVKASDIIVILERVLKLYPDISQEVFKMTEDGTSLGDISYLVNQFSKDRPQKDLSAFLSNKGIFEFVSIMTQESDFQKNKTEQKETPKRFHLNYVEIKQVAKSSQTRICFNELADTYNSDSSYYSLVNTLPESCLNVLGNAGFVGQIYLWMNASNNYFKDIHGVDDFHSGVGIWSPGMLQFLFSTAIKADITLENSEGSVGILNNIDEIHRVVTDPLLLEMFHRFSQLYNVVDNTINFELKLLNYVESSSETNLYRLAADIFKISKSTPPYATINSYKISCRDIDFKLGANPCLTKEELTLSSLKMLRVLKRKNENNDSLIKELVKLYHPQVGIDLPFRQPKTRNHKASIDETIRFLYDLSSEKTIKKFQYTTSSGKNNVQGTVIDRLEVVIRDISFDNNFYGAYFKNMVASADNYRKDVSGSEKLLKALDHSSGVMRRMNALPRDSKNRLKNVRQSYESLIELSDDYMQADGTTRTYDGLIQGLLAAVAESSKLRTQKFNPYRIPDEEVVNGHNGEFLTEVVNISGLRHLSSFVRSHFDNKLSALNSPEFKKIDKNLIGRFESAKVQDAAQSILDKFLDNDRNQLNVFIADVINFMGSLNESERKNLEEIILEALVLVSDERLSNNNIEDLIQLVQGLLDSWPEIRQILIKVDSKSELLEMLNKAMDGLTKNPGNFDSLLSSLKLSQFLKLSDLKELAQSEEFRTQAALFLNQLSKTSHLKTSLNWDETFEAMFASSNMKWAPLSNWIQSALGQKKDKLTVSLLISFLGEKQGNQYRLKGIMDELFLFHREQLNQFLSETFKSLSLNSD